MLFLFSFMQSNLSQEPLINPSVVQSLCQFSTHCKYGCRGTNNSSVLLGIDGLLKKVSFSVKSILDELHNDCIRCWKSGEPDCSVYNGVKDSLPLLGYTLQEYD